MRVREFLFVMVLVSLALIKAEAAAPIGFENEVWPVFGNEGNEHGSNAKTDMSTSVPLIPAPPIPSTLIHEDRVLGSAYHDTLRILRAANDCSNFFGGPDASVDIFNKLMGSISKDYFQSAVAMRMSGETTTVFNARTKAQFRLFKRVAVNAFGPFYKKRVSSSAPAMPRVGSFEPDTKEARVLIFLHELGHIVKGADGKWLLPNDGNDEGISRNNTKKIEDVCGDEIKSLAKGEAGTPIEATTTRDE
jgi:hypothetical protein